MKTLEDNKVNELVGGDINAGGGDRNVTNNSEIETGPVDKPFNDNSDYEKGTPTTTDKVFGRYRQNIPWFAVYSYGGLSGGAGRGLPYIREEKPKKVVTKKSVEEKIEDLVKKSKDSDVTDKNYDAKLDKIINIIDDSDMTDSQLDTIVKAITAKKENPIKTKKL
jgi:hypothetical protein